MHHATQPKMDQSITEADLGGDGNDHDRNEDSEANNGAEVYEYVDHSHERAYYDPCFEGLFQTADVKRKLPAKLNAMLSNPGEVSSAELNYL